MKDQDTNNEETSPLDEIEEAVDQLEQRKATIDTSLRMEDEDDKYPEQIGTIYTKYRTEPDIPKHQRKYFDEYRGAYGRHVALSNTYRKDNLRHLNAIDLQYIYDDIPVMRHRAFQIRVRETSEFQMCRSNPEIGGFEAKLGATVIKREDVDLKQAQSLTDNRLKKKKSGILGFLVK